MPTTYPIGNLIRRGVRLQPHEAVAIAQRVIAALTDDLNAHAASGPPTIETVYIAADGAVSCPGCATPSVFEIGLFLDSMLAHGCGIKVPGALQYLVARALGEVEAPRFASVAEVSQVLTRCEDGDSRTVVAGLFARASASASTMTGHPTVGMRERRRTTISATELRRYLHDVDRELFLARSRSAEVPSGGTAVPVRSPPARRRSIAHVGCRSHITRTSARPGAAGRGLGRDVGTPGAHAAIAESRGSTRQRHESDACEHYGSRTGSRGFSGCAV